MTPYIIAAISALLFLFLLIIFVRAVLFKPHMQPALPAIPVSVNTEKVITDMQDMIRIKTVSHTDERLTDYAEFDKFKALLEDRFPLIHKCATRRFLGKTGILYQIPGQAADAPCVCMAHYDVVPAHECDWEKPAFDGLIADDVMWGRGTLDTKSTLCGIMEAVETLLAQNFKPKQDLYLAFSGDEEINGESCPAMVSWFAEQGITPAMVLDEGGAVVENVFPGVEQECALVGIAEKSSVNLELSLKSRGGHASTPPIHTTAGNLAKAMVTIEKKLFKARLTPAVREMFDTLGRHSSFGYRILFANLWCFKPLLYLVCRFSGGELNAMVRTTCALTKMQGSDAFNVLPPSAAIGMNLRLMSGDTIDSALSYLKRIVKNDDITYTVESGMNPSDCSHTKCEAWETLGNAIRSCWPEAIVSPYLMMACSDSRHYCRITDKVYRFSPMKLSAEERAMIHGNNERIPLDTLLKTVEFYIRLIGYL